MCGTSDGTTMTTCEIGNLRFLIEHQLEVIATLERQGLDLKEASDLLGKLMRRDEEIRGRMNGGQQAVPRGGIADAPRHSVRARRFNDPSRACRARGVKVAAAPYMEGDRSQSG